MSNKKLTFEESINSLQKVIEQLESGTNSLDEMLSLYEKGVKLTNECKSHLADAEKRVTSLINEDGKLKEIDGI